VPNEAEPPLEAGAPPNMVVVEAGAAPKTDVDWGAPNCGAAEVAFCCCGAPKGEEPKAEEEDGC